MNKIGIEHNEEPSNLKSISKNKIFIFERVARKYLIHDVIDYPSVKNSLIFTAHVAYDENLISTEDEKRKDNPNRVKAIKVTNDRIIKKILVKSHYLFHAINPYFTRVIATRLDDGFLYIDVLPYSFSNKAISDIFIKDKNIYLKIKCNITNKTKIIPYSKDIIYQNITMED